MATRALSAASAASSAAPVAPDGSHWPSRAQGGDDRHDDDGRERKGKRDAGVALKERTRTAKPPMYKVMVHNDDYTTKEFVVMVLQSIFRLDESGAVRVMVHVHNSGVGVAGVYTHEVAETKIHKTKQLAQAYEYPLQLSMEPAD